MESIVLIYCFFGASSIRVSLNKVYNEKSVAGSSLKTNSGSMGSSLFCVD